MSTRTKVTKTAGEIALRQETYNLSDLKHDPHCGFVELELGDSARGSESVTVSWQHHWHKKR